MSPILVRPVREQLEHDRVIRLLQAKYKRKFEVGINPGNEQAVPVGNGPAPWYPDLVLQSQERSRKLLGVIEVETAESVNQLEAMSQWVTFSRLRAPFYLYVPTACIDSTRRMCADLNVALAELWAYQAVGDQIRFALIERSTAAEPKGRAASEPAEKAKAAPRAAAPRAAAPRPASRNGGDAATARSARPAASRSARRTAPAPATRRAATAKAAKPAARRTTAKTPARKAAAPARSQKRR